MRLPESFLDAFEAHTELIAEVERLAEPRLRLLCHENGWLFDHRRKSAESTFAKLETGDYDSLRALVDAYAAMVVVPTHAFIAQAVEGVLGRFNGDVKMPRTDKPEAFPYDDVHLIAYLGSHVSPAVVTKPVREHRFEIQIRTGLQYAWWWATHDTVYKGAVREWETQRLAGQARASLELLDGVLADIPEAAKLQVMAPPGGAPKPPPQAAWLDLWPAAARPADEDRFCKTVDALLLASGVAPEDVGAALASDAYELLRASESLGPMQTVVIALIRTVGIEWVAQLGDRRLLVTPEMVAAEPSLGGIDPAHKVAL